MPSGDVGMEGWFSPNLQVSYAGSPAIERDVVESVASFGKQIGILSEAVLELAAEHDGEKVGRLRELVQRVEEVKSRHRSTVRRDAEDALDRLGRLDQDELKGLLRRYKAGQRGS